MFSWDLLGQNRGASSTTDHTTRFSTALAHRRYLLWSSFRLGHLLLSCVKMADPPNRPTCFTGKTALVTGGSNGMGRAVAEALADRGCAVTLVDVNVDDGNEAVRERKQKRPDVRSSTAAATLRSHISLS